MQILRDEDLGWRETDPPKLPAVSHDALCPGSDWTQAPEKFRRARTPHVEDLQTRSAQSLRDATAPRDGRSRTRHRLWPSRLLQRPSRSRPQHAEADRLPRALGEPAPLFIQESKIAILPGTALTTGHWASLSVHRTAS